MALTKIFTGMELGPEAIDANFKAVEITDTGWVTDGIVYSNGFVKDAVDPFAYRIIKYGTSGLINVYLAGSANKGSTKLGLVNHKPVVAATFPRTVANYISGSNYHTKSVIGRYQLNYAGVTIRQDFLEDGSLKFQSMGADASDSFFIDSIYILLQIN